MSSNVVNETIPCGAYDEIGGVVHFSRMADKARLHAAGRLPNDSRLTWVRPKKQRLMGVAADFWGFGMAISLPR